jgi:hypothetical protein
LTNSTLFSCRGCMYVNCKISFNHETFDTCFYGDIQIIF